MIIDLNDNTYDSLIHQLLAHLCSITLARVPVKFSHPGGSSSGRERFLGVDGLVLGDGWTAIACPTSGVEDEEDCVPGAGAGAAAAVVAAVAAAAAGNNCVRTFVARGFVSALTILGFVILAVRKLLMLIIFVYRFDGDVVAVNY